MGNNSESACGDGGNANLSLIQQQGNTDDQTWWRVGGGMRGKASTEFDANHGNGETWKNQADAGGARRLASILSFLAMLICRIVYLWIVYKSDNKSLYVFIVLCIEGFWFGTFQMGFFAIGPEYNAFTSFGIHTMGNFIFFGQLIMQRQSKTRPEMNSLYRVRVHGWVCFVTSVIALVAWLGFCLGASGDNGLAPLAVKWKERLAEGSVDLGTVLKDMTRKEVKRKAVVAEEPKDAGTAVELYDVLSPFLLFIVGAFVVNQSLSSHTPPDFCGL